MKPNSYVMRTEVHIIAGSSVCTFTAITRLSRHVLWSSGRDNERDSCARCHSYSVQGDAALHIQGHGAIANFTRSVAAVVHGEEVHDRQSRGKVQKGRWSTTVWLRNEIGCYYNGPLPLLAVPENASLSLECPRHVRLRRAVWRSPHPVPMPPPHRQERRLCIRVARLYLAPEASGQGVGRSHHAQRS